MHDHSTANVGQPQEPAAGADPAPAIDTSAGGSKDAQPKIRFATDAEVDEAMGEIFQKHDRLFKELAK